MSKKNNNPYYLGDEYPNVYFTQREVDCLTELLAGHTIASAAEMLSLSPRTVEFYVKNMRMKMGVRTKTELIKKIRKMDFIYERKLKPFFFNKSFSSDPE